MPGNAVAMHNLGVLNKEDGRVDEAEPAITQFVGMLEQAAHTLGR